MANDPTANTAARNIEGQKRAAYIVFQNEDGHKERLWFDPENFKTLIRLGGTFRDESGERHYRFRREVAEADTNTSWTITSPQEETPSPATSDPRNRPAVTPNPPHSPQPNAPV